MIVSGQASLGRAIGAWLDPVGVVAVVAGVAGVCAAALLLVPPAMMPATLLLGLALLALGVCDAAAFRLPDWLTLPLCLAGLALHAPAVAPQLAGMLGEGLACAAVVALFAAFGRDALGQGDVKLAAAGGAWLGLSAVPAMLLLACLGAMMWIGALRLLRGGTALTRPIAFGVPLAAAIWLLWLSGA